MYAHLIDGVNIKAFTEADWFEDEPAHARPSVVHRADAGQEFVLMLDFLGTGADAVAIQGNRAQLVDLLNEALAAVVIVVPYRDSLTEAGQFIYDRLTQEDDERSETDPVRKGKYEPCCQEHRPDQICMLKRGHDIKDIEEI